MVANAGSDPAPQAGDGAGMPLQASTAASIGGLDAEARGRLYGGRAEGAGYYEALAGEGGDTAIAVSDAAGVVAASPSFDIGFDGRHLLPAALQWSLLAGRRLLPRLGMVRVAGLGSVHANELGLSIDPRLDATRREAALEALLAGCETRDGRRPDVTVVKDVSDRDAAWADPILRRRGYLRIAGLPLAWLHLPYDSLEAFLASRPKKVRQSINANIRNSSAVIVEVREDCHGIEDELNRLAEATRLRAATGFDGLEAFPPDFFGRMAQLAAGQARFFLYRYDGRLLGFTFCLVSAEALYAKTIGLAYPEALEHRTYFRALVSYIEWAIAQRRRWLCLGQLNYDIKLRYGARLERRWIYIKPRPLWAVGALLARPWLARVSLAPGPDLADRDAWFATSPGIEPPPSITMQTVLPAQ